MKKRSQSLSQKAMQALIEAVAKAVQEHQRRGIPIAVWRDGKAISIFPPEVGVLHEAPTPSRNKTTKAQS